MLTPKTQSSAITSIRRKPGSLQNMRSYYTRLCMCTNIEFTIKGQRYLGAAIGSSEFRTTYTTSDNITMCPFINCWKLQNRLRNQQMQNQKMGKRINTLFQNIHLNLFQRSFKLLKKPKFHYCITSMLFCVLYYVYFYS